MKLNNENFPYFEDTTKLSFTRDEEEKTTKEINKMLDFIDKMKEEYDIDGNEVAEVVINEFELDEIVRQ